MKIFLDIVSVSPIEIAADMFSLFAPWLLGGIIVIGTAILIAKAVKRKK